MKLYDETLNALENGGRAMNHNIRVPSKAVKMMAKNARNVWQPIKIRIKRLIDEKPSEEETHQICKDILAKLPLLFNASSDLVEIADSSYRKRSIYEGLNLLFLIILLFISLIFLKTHRYTVEKIYKKYEKALEYIGDGVIITDMDGRIEYVNPAFTETTGYKWDEVTDKLIDTLNWKLHDGSFSDVIKSTIFSKKIWRGVIINKKKNGEISYILMTISPYLNKRGRIINFIYSGKDITEDRKREERIVRLNRLLKTISEINQLIVREKERDSLLRKTCQILVEEGGFRMVWIGGLNNKTGEILPLAFYGFEEGYLSEIKIRYDDTPEGNGPTGMAVKTGQYVVCDDLEKGECFVPWREAAKKRGYKSSGAFPYKIKDRIKGTVNVYSEEPHAFQDEFISLLNDMAGNLGFALEKMELSEEGTQLKEILVGIESQLQQAMKMEAVGRLAGGIAHDFNNILASIINFSEISLTFKMEPSLARIIGEIKKTAEKAGMVTSQLLAFSRNQAIEMKVININKSIESMGEMLKRLIGEDVSLSVLSTPDIYGIKANPSQIEQIIMNLVVNARDAMPKGGRILMETNNITIDDSNRLSHPAVPRGNYVLLSVSDSGVGIQKENLDKIFEPFFTTKPSGKGTGLGLSTVYGIVKQSDGFIEVMSELGKGTSFRIYLPAILENSENIEPQGDEVKEETGGCGCILLAEDDEQVRESTEMVLQYLGYKVIAVSCLEEAREAFEENEKSIDMLLTDMKMPDGTGLALYRELSERREDLKTLFMSGYTSDVVNGGFPDGTSFIQKPFTMASLAENIRKILGSK